MLSSCPPASWMAPDVLRASHLRYTYIARQLLKVAGYRRFGYPEVSWQMFSAGRRRVTAAAASRVRRAAGLLNSKVMGLGTPEPDPAAPPDRSSVSTGVMPPDGALPGELLLHATETAVATSTLVLGCLFSMLGSKPQTRRSTRKDSGEAPRILTLQPSSPRSNSSNGAALPTTAAAIGPLASSAAVHQPAGSEPGSSGGSPDPQAPPRSPLSPGGRAGGDGDGRGPPGGGGGGPGGSGWSGSSSSGAYSSRGSGYGGAGSGSGGGGSSGGNNGAGAGTSGGGGAFGGSAGRGGGGSGRGSGGGGAPHDDSSDGSGGMVWLLALAAALACWSPLSAAVRRLWGDEDDVLFDESAADPNGEPLHHQYAQQPQYQHDLYHEGQSQVPQRLEQPERQGNEARAVIAVAENDLDFPTSPRCSVPAPGSPSSVGKGLLLGVAAGSAFRIVRPTAAGSAPASPTGPVPAPGAASGRAALRQTSAESWSGSYSGPLLGSGSAATTATASGYPGLWPSGNDGGGAATAGHQVGAGAGSRLHREQDAWASTDPYGFWHGGDGWGRRALGSSAAPAGADVAAADGSGSGDGAGLAAGGLGGDMRLAASGRRVGRSLGWAAGPGGNTGDAAADGPANTWGRGHGSADPAAADDYAVRGISHGGDDVGGAVHSRRWYGQASAGTSTAAAAAATAATAAAVGGAEMAALDRRAGLTSPRASAWTQTAASASGVAVGSQTVAPDAPGAEAVGTQTAAGPWYSAVFTNLGREGRGAREVPAAQPHANTRRASLSGTGPGAWGLGQPGAGVGDCAAADSPSFSPGHDIPSSPAGRGSWDGRPERVLGLGVLAGPECRRLYGLGSATSSNGDSDWAREGGGDAARRHAADGTEHSSGGGGGVQVGRPSIDGALPSVQREEGLGAGARDANRGPASNVDGIGRSAERCEAGAGWSLPVQPLDHQHQHHHAGQQAICQRQAHQDGQQQQQQQELPYPALDRSGARATLDRSSGRDRRSEVGLGVDLGLVALASPPDTNNRPGPRSHSLVPEPPGSPSVWSRGREAPSMSTCATGSGLDGRQGVDRHVCRDGGGGREEASWAGRAADPLGCGGTLGGRGRSGARGEGVCMAGSDAGRGFFSTADVSASARGVGTGLDSEEEMALNASAWLGRIDRDRANGGARDYGTGTDFGPLGVMVGGGGGAKGESVGVLGELSVRSSASYGGAFPSSAAANVMLPPGRAMIHGISDGGAVWSSVESRAAGGGGGGAAAAAAVPPTSDAIVLFGGGRGSSGGASGLPYYAASCDDGPYAVRSPRAADLIRGSTAGGGGGIPYIRSPMRSVGGTIIREVGPGEDAVGGGYGGGGRPGSDAAAGSADGRRGGGSIVVTPDLRQEIVALGAATSGLSDAHSRAERWLRSRPPVAVVSGQGTPAPPQ